MKYIQHISILIFSVISLIVAFNTDSALFTAIVNSDALYIPTMVDDVMSRGGSINEWHLTPAPYFFPDGLIYLTISLLGIRPYPGIYVYAIIQYLITIIFVFFIYRIFNLKIALSATILSAVTLAFLALFVGDSITLSTTGNTFIFILTTAFHYGSFLASLIGFWIVARCLNNTDKKSLLTLTIICALTTLSDSLFIVQFIAPILGTLALNFLKNQRRDSVKYLWISISILIGYMLGHFAYAPLIANPKKYAIGIDLSNLNVKINTLINFAFELSSKQPVIAALLVIFYFYALFNLVKSFASIKTNKLNPTIYLLLDFSLLCAFSMFFANLLASHMQFGIRYIIPFFYLPVIYTTYAIFTKFKEGVLNYFSLAISAILIIGSFNLTSDARVTQQRSEATCVANAIDSNNLRHGVATYWDAKLIQAITKSDTQIAQFTGDLKDYRWITNSQWYRPAYDYIIISNDQVDFYKISSEKIVNLNGQPNKIVNCGEKQLFLYGEDRLRLRKNKFTEVGNFYSWQACELPTKIGRRSEHCSMSKSDITSSGHLTYGPYDSLSVGQYKFIINYQSRDPKEINVGIWDIALALPSEARVLTSGNIQGTDGIQKNIVGTFDVQSHLDMTDFEARTYALNNKDLTIFSVQLIRIK